MFKIIKQPNGLYCIFNEISDTIMRYNCKQKDIINYESKKRKYEIKRILNILKRDMVLSKLEYNDMFKKIKKHHGNEGIKLYGKIKKLMENKKI